MKRPWSEHDANLAEQWHQSGMSLSEIAEALDRSRDSVRSKLFPRYIKKGCAGINWGWSEGPIRESQIAAQKRVKLYGEAKYEDR